MNSSWYSIPGKKLVGKENFIPKAFTDQNCNFLKT